MGGLDDWRKYIREPIHPDVTMEELLQYWIRELERQDSASTKDVKSAVKRQILPAFAGMKAKDVLPIYIEGIVSPSPVLTER